MELEASRSMPAIKEIVFAEASRVDVIGQWLAATYGDEVAQQDPRRADPERWCVEWGAPGVDRCTGWLRVTDSGAGASDVTVHVSAPGGADARPQPGELRQRLEDVLAGLHDSVLQRVSDAS